MKSEMRLLDPISPSRFFILDFVTGSKLSIKTFSEIQCIDIQYNNTQLNNSALLKSA